MCISHREECRGDVNRGVRGVIWVFGGGKREEEAWKRGEGTFRTDRFFPFSPSTGLRTRFSFTIMLFMLTFFDRCMAPTVALGCASNWPLMKRLVSEVLPFQSKSLASRLPSSSFLLKGASFTPPSSLSSHAPP